MPRACRLYKQQMLDYHKDRVQHLGAELRKLAERKALEITALAIHSFPQIATPMEIPSETHGK
jgi:hypothetical protein